MTCRVGPLTPANYAAFSRRLTEGAIDRRYSESSTAEILTLVAWDGLEIAGVARLLSDGYGARVPTGGRLTRA